MLKKLTVLLTGCGSPSAGINTATSLRLSKHYDVRVVGVDMKEKPGFDHFLDVFYQIPAANHSDYLPRISNVVQQESVDIIFPLTDVELMPLLNFSEQTGMVVVGPEKKAVAFLQDKGLLLQTLVEHRFTSAQVFLPTTIPELQQAVYSLGYPYHEVVLKPRFSSGARGVWIISENFNRRDHLYGRQFPPFIKLAHLLDLLEEPLSNVLVMPLFEGEDYTICCLNTPSTGIKVLPVLRKEFKPGITWSGTLVYDEEIISYVSQLVQHFALTPFINVQLKRSNQTISVYEINPRISATTTICTRAGINIPDAIVHYYMKEVYPVEKIRWGLEFQRYAQEFYDK